MQCDGVSPELANVEAKPTEDGRLVLRFQDGSFKDPFIARYVSDGTLRCLPILYYYTIPNLTHCLLSKNPKISFTQSCCRN